MRYAVDHKEKSRARVVRSAAAQLRARGVEAVRLADVMSAAGMTNGGFYKHFENKDEIVEEAISSALTDLADQLARKARGLPRREGLRRVIEFYLSDEHMRHPEHGCAIAALGSEIARLPSRMRRRVREALNAYEACVSHLMPGDSDEHRHGAFLVLFSSMAGCLTAARAAVDEEERRKILAAGREFFVRAFCGADRTSRTARHSEEGQP